MNKGNGETCEKCGSALRGQSAPGAGDSGGMSEESKKTVVFRPEHTPPPAGRSKRHCPNCGYPVWSDMNICPQCKSALQSQEASLSQGEVRPAPAEEDLSDLKKTINPYLNARKSRRRPEITLSPLTGEGGARTYEGGSVCIGRDGAPSVGEDYAALFTLDNGRWFVEAGKGGRVSVQATRKIEVRPGDVVMVDGLQYRVDSAGKGENQ